MVAAIADVNSDLAKHGFKDWVPRVALHVVGRLVKVTHTWDVVLEQVGEGRGRGRGLDGFLAFCVAVARMSDLSI